MTELELYKTQCYSIKEKAHSIAIGFENDIKNHNLTAEKLFKYENQLKYYNDGLVDLNCNLSEIYQISITSIHSYCLDIEKILTAYLNGTIDIKLFSKQIDKKYYKAIMEINTTENALY